MPYEWAPGIGWRYRREETEGSKGRKKIFTEGNLSRLNMDEEFRTTKHEMHHDARMQEAINAENARRAALGLDPYVPGGYQRSRSMDRWKGTSIHPATSPSEPEILEIPAEARPFMRGMGDIASAPGGATPVGSARAPAKEIPPEALAHMRGMGDVAAARGYAPAPKTIPAGAERFARGMGDIYPGAPKHMPAGSMDFTRGMGDVYPTSNRREASAEAPPAREGAAGAQYFEPRAHEEVSTPRKRVPYEHPSAAGSFANMIRYVFNGIGSFFSKMMGRGPEAPHAEAETPRHPLQQTATVQPENHVDNSNSGQLSPTTVAGAAPVSTKRKQK